MNAEEFKELENNASSGDAESMYKLAKLHRYGKTFNTVTIPRNRNKTIELLQGASNKGHIKSKELLKNIDKHSVFITTLVYIDDAADQIGEFFNNLKHFIASTVYIVVGILLFIAIIVLIVKGVSALPVSLAIIIGAVIIALAVKK